VSTDLLRERLAGSLSEHYVLQRELGRGGMATVYLARDVKHDRLVALKVLDPDLGAVLGAERFLSEIRVTANLQHPNLLPLFDSGATDGLLWYVMPYVEGESLRARLDRERQLPMDTAVHIAVSIAGALDYAHKHSVIHRDLKPENILLQHGEPVVADFGIALAISNAGGQRVTQTGLSLGTPQYMSPEQATGDRVIDARSDIYSLGAVTYEMISGEPPHLGTTAQAIIARLMTETPRALSVIRPSVPEHVDEAVQRALEKLPADRFNTAREFADALRGATSSSTTVRSSRRNSARPRTSRFVRVALAASIISAMILAVLLGRALSRPEPAPVRFVLDVPADQRLQIANGSSVSLSPDGRTVAYVASRRDGSGRGIFVRRLDSLVAHPLPGGEGGIAPLFSPDGRFLAFRNTKDLRRVPLAGGPPELLYNLLAWNGFGWGTDGDLLLSVDNNVWKIGARGTRTRLTTLDTARLEALHAGPWQLTDDVIGFSIFTRKEGVLSSSIGVARIGDKTHVDLGLSGDTPLAYVDGHLLYSGSAGSLLAVPFDARHLKVTGSPIALVDSIMWIFAGGLQANVAANGTFAYIQGSAGGKLAVLDPRGAMIAETSEIREYRSAALSPDGSRVVFTLSPPAAAGESRVASDIWLWDIASRTMNRLTTDGGTAPTWFADGKRIAFLRTADKGIVSGVEIWAVPADGSAPPQRIHRVPGLRTAALSISPSGRYATFVVIGDTTQLTDIYTAELSAVDVKPVPLLAGRFREDTPVISPDERWLAYTSTETGKAEVYVRPFRADGPRVKVSVDGGSGSNWASGGKRLLYRQGATQVAATLDFTSAVPTVIRRETMAYDGVRVDVSRSTDRVLVTRNSDDLRIVVVTNWLADVRAKLRRR
jgi:serine/threonine protein kinase/Tol biopolymer transport system component